MKIGAEGTNLQMEMPSNEQGQNSEMIYRGDRDEMVIVDHGQKTFMVMDEAAIQKIGGLANEAMKQMEEALKNVPEDRRAMVEQMMKERLGDVGATSKAPTVEVRKTTERATRKGYPCEKFEVHQGGRKVRDLWVTDWKNIEGAAEARGAFEDMADFFQQLTASLPKGGMFSGASSGSNIMTEMKDLNGFPVEGTEFSEDGSVESEFSLKSSQRRTLDPDEFEPPAGYKRQSMPGGF